MAQPGEIRMVDDLNTGRRPVVKDGASTERALRACPGVELSHDRSSWSAGWDPVLADEWGPVLAVWEGYASDEVIRFRGSSGGAATALSLWSLETGQAEAVVHTAARPEALEFNDAVLSRSRSDLLERTGSRYAPASPCEGISDVTGSFTLVGKPCDVAGGRKLEDHGLLPHNAKMGLSIAIFCAGAPSTRATLDYLGGQWGDGPERLTELRYRGRGWPGKFVARDDAGNSHEATYAESWGVIQAGRPWRCRVCPDHTGEFADVSVGDPWHTAPEPGAVGRSLVVARTSRGVEAVEQAMAAGFLELERVDHRLLPASQDELRKTRSAVFGRILAMKIVGVPTPSFRGLSLFRTWLFSSPRNVMRSVLGTLRRVGRYGLRQPVPVVELGRERGQWGRAVGDSVGGGR